MYKIILATLLLTISNSTHSYAQNLNMFNQVSIGGTSSDYFTKVVPSPTNDGYYALGYSMSASGGNKSCQGSGDFDIWLLKLDHDFSVEWDKCFGGTGFEVASDILILDEKIYVASSAPTGVSGNKTTPGFGSDDIWILCLDLDGDILWQESYGGDGGELVTSLLESTANSILISGISGSDVSGNKTTPSYGSGDAWLIEIDKANGAIIRQKTIGSIATENAAKIYKSANNTYYLIVDTYEGISNDKTEAGYGDADIWLMEIDTDFNILKSKIFGGSSEERKAHLVFDQTNLYLACYSYSEASGNKSSDNYFINLHLSINTWLLKLDQDFNIIWDKCYGGYDSEMPENIELTSNNLILVSTLSRSEYSGNKTAPTYGILDNWSFLINKDGDIMREFSYGGTSTSRTKGIITKLENEYIFAAYSDGPASGTKFVSTNGMEDFWLGKIDLESILNTASILPEASVSVYPNPFTHEVAFNLASIHESVIIDIYTMDGKWIQSEKIPANQETYTLNLSVSNVYTYHINGSATNLTGKIVKL